MLRFYIGGLTHHWQANVLEFLPFAVHKELQCPQLNPGSKVKSPAHIAVHRKERTTQAVNKYRVLCSLLQKYSRSWRRVQPNVSWNCLATACAVVTILFTPGP